MFCGQDAGMEAEVGAVDGSNGPAFVGEFYARTITSIINSLLDAISLMKPYRYVPGTSYYYF